MLEVREITAGYGAAQALFGVSLSVPRGGLTALLGRNGMGKTTTVRAICGLLPISAGTVRMDETSLVGMPAHRIARCGLGLVPEGRRLFAGLTVRENLLVTARPGHWDQTRVHALFPRLAERQGQRADTLSGGEQQMLAIGRALMTNPRLLILDEATEGLAPVIRQEIWNAIAALKGQGIALLVIDKVLAELLPLADTCLILDRGRDMWHGPPSALTRSVRGRLLGLEA
ncbi:MAG: ABC transporter ATP-binding protein [Pseudomonadota bacterium]